MIKELKQIRKLVQAVMDRNQKLKTQKERRAHGFLDLYEALRELDLLIQSVEESGLFN